MSEQDIEILKLTSFALRREKQYTIREEFDRYAAATNFVIKEILRNHLSNFSRTIEILQDAIAKNYDTRVQFIHDVVKTARGVIGQHRKLAKTIRSMRTKTPFFKPGNMIFSHPIVSVDEGALIIQTKSGDKLPIPFDKHSRNQSAEILRYLSKNHKIYGRIRLTWDDIGSYVKIAIRFNRSRIKNPKIP